MLNPCLGALSPNVVVVDDFFVYPHDVRNFGMRQAYVEDNERYRGFRSTGRYLFAGVKERFEKLLGRSITKWDEHGYNGVFQWAPGGTQVVFHSDLQQYAAVVYLTPDAPPSAGTTLYRSKRNKLRCPEEAVNAEYRSLAAREMYDGKLLDPTAWETVDVIGNRYNRLVIWNGRLAHAASAYFGTTIDNSRFWQIYFFDA